MDENSPTQLCYMVTTVRTTNARWHHAKKYLEHFQLICIETESVNGKIHVNLRQLNYLNGKKQIKENFSDMCLEFLSLFHLLKWSPTA